MSKLIKLLLSPLSLGIVFGIGTISFTLWEVKFFFQEEQAKGLVLGGPISLLLLTLSASLLAYSKLKEEHNNTQTLTPILLFFSTLILLTNWSSMRFGFLPDSYLAPAVLVIALCFLPFSSPIFQSKNSLNYLTPLLSLLFFLTLLISSNFSPLFTDDHGPVIYRLQLLRENFPNIPVYNTEWNAGYDWRDFFATGILNVFFIFYPFIKLWGVLTSYTYIVPTILFILLPIATYLGSKLFGVSTKGSLIASLLSITSSTIWYRWGLSYGSLGFVCSTALIPLSYALLIHCINPEKEVSWRDIFLTALCLTLTIFWSAQAISLIPILIYCLFNIKRLLFNKKILTLALSLIFINIPWMYSFIHVSKVTSFVQPTGSKASKIMGLRVGDKIETEASVIRAKKGSLSTKVVTKRLREFLTKLNPLILLLIIPSLIYCSFSKTERNLLRLTALFLLAVGLIGPSLKPQLELERFLIVMSMLMCIPIGDYLGKFLESNFKNTKTYSFSIYSLSCMFIIGPLSIFSCLENKGFNKYTAWPEDLVQLASSIKENTGSGRAFFSGFVLHELGNGHLAPLSTLSKTPIVASSPVHKYWWYTDIIPEEFRELSSPGIEEYLDHMNVSLVIAHEKLWRNLFRASPWQYQELGQIGNFTLFKRNNFPNSYFLQGSGDLLEQDSNHVKLKITSSEAVLRFNYFPFLEVDGCESISAFPIRNSLEFVSLSGCRKNEEIIIRSVPLYKRVLG